MIATDATVRFRKHRDGSMTILSVDGMRVIDHISASEFRFPKPESTKDEPTAECRGFMFGMLVASVIWVGFFFLMKWVAGA